jgi:hypothetical protein
MSDNNSFNDGHLMVHVRIRPIQGEDICKRPCIEAKSTTSVSTLVGGNRYEQMSFDTVSPPPTEQQTIFETVARSICDACLEGTLTVHIDLYQGIMVPFLRMAKLVLVKLGPCKDRLVQVLRV